jgi:large subunit ribosomal protein L29
MNTTELRTQDEAGLAKEIKDLQRAHFNLRMQKATQQLGNTNQLRETRRSIARAKTCSKASRQIRSDHDGS